MHTLLCGCQTENTRFKLGKISCRYFPLLCYNSTAQLLRLRWPLCQSESVNKVFKVAQTIGRGEASSETAKKYGKTQARYAKSWNKCCSKPTSSPNSPTCLLGRPGIPCLCLSLRNVPLSHSFSLGQKLPAEPKPSLKPRKLPVQRRNNV